MKNLIYLLAGLVLFSCGTRDAFKVAFSKSEICECYPDYEKCSGGPPGSLPFYERPNLALVYFSDKRGNEYLIVAPDCISPHRAQVDSIRRFLDSAAGIPPANVLFHANHNHQIRRFAADKLCLAIVGRLATLRKDAVPADMGHVRTSGKNLFFNRRVFISPELGTVTLGDPFHAVSDIKSGTFDNTRQVIDYFEGVKIDKAYYLKGEMADHGLPSAHLKAFVREIRDSGRTFFADGPVDDRLDWVIFRDPEKKRVLGSLVRFSAHRNTAPYFLTQALSGATGGAPAVFMIGTAGDAGLLEATDGSVYSLDKRLSEMRRIGGEMAARLKAGLDTMHYAPPGAFAWRRANAGLEVARDIRQNRGSLAELEARWEADYQKVRASDCTPLAYKQARDKSGRGWAISRADHYPDTLYADITLLCLNDLAILGLPGEILYGVGAAIRQNAHRPDLLIVELCDDGREAYIPPPGEFKNGGYEVINSRLSSAGVQALIDASAGLLADAGL